MMYRMLAYQLWLIKYQARSHVDLVFLFGKGCFQGLIFVQYAYEKIQTVELDRLWLSPALFRCYICFSSIQFTK